MKLVSFLTPEKEEKSGLLVDDKVYDLQASAAKINIDLPDNMAAFLWGGQAAMDLARKVNEAAFDGKVEPVSDRASTQLLSPVPHPTCCRDAYAFRQHVATARRNRGVDMIPEFDQFPVFYFTNHNATFGEGDIFLEVDHFHRLDFELECAVVIGRQGRNIAAEDADSYIAGYMILNDLSARQLQMEEMKLNLGPAKGKDFANTFGPWLVTVDELENKKITTSSGDKYDLRMTAYHNGKLVSDGNLKDMNWTFAEIIERVSYGVDIFPGDVIGSGTVGTGCYLELNGTRALQAKEKGEEFSPTWLKDGDTIELEIDSLGRLKNRLLKSADNYSILAKKKNV
jgi:fumarylacetoacetate (FAA) hydrolase